MLEPVPNGRAPRATPRRREDGRARGGRIRRLKPERAGCRMTGKGYSSGGEAPACSWRGAPVAR
eukprot:5229929-Lingulodinium_polyedra.AAC.1